MKRALFLVAWLFLMQALPAQNKNTPYVVLISFDGFRADYVEKFNLPNFKRFIREGAAADGLIPSFPSKTFPNHYTIVTGLYPGHHGLVDNYFYDPVKKQGYSMRNKQTVIDSAYYGGIPLWRLAKQQGMISASYFWVGSEIKEKKLHPDYYLEYDQSVPFQDRIDQVIRWLGLPEKERPHMITLYFSSPDTESHRYGPWAEETRQKVLSVDSLLGGLMSRIDSVNLPVNVILVSDHGMSEVTQKSESYVFIDELIKTKPGSINVVNGGTQAHVYTNSQGQTDSLFSILQANALGFTVIKREDFPARWNYNHQRSGNLLIVAKEGKYIVGGDRTKFLNGLNYGSTFGVHGYDPDQVKDMRGIFYAKGPNIKRGAKIPAFRNIHIYPLITNILHLKSPPVDGEFEVLKPIYQN